MAATQAIAREPLIAGVLPLAALEQQVLDNWALRQHVLELQTALIGIRSGSFTQVQHGMQTLRVLCRAFQDFAQWQFRREETLLYRPLEEALPPLRNLLGELRGELKSFQRIFENFREAVLIFNASGELGRLPRLGQDLVNLLGKHLHRQETELYPMLQEYLEPIR
ncbi:MAG: hemerythrin domain-containing protein [Candidatus Acidiferrales bacterium]